MTRLSVLLYVSNQCRDSESCDSRVRIRNVDDLDTVRPGTQKTSCCNRDAGEKIGSSWTT